ncbi:MAG TPA: hypothetical protein VGH72_05060, partial [Pseudonocardia sp.]
ATRSRSETTSIASTNLAVLSATAQRLTEGALPDSGVRLIGVSLSGLTGAVQQYLFETGTAAETGSAAETGTAAAVGTEAGTGAELATAEGSGAESVAVADGTAVGAEQVEADGPLLGATAVGNGTTSTASAPTPVDGVAGARVAAGSVATLLSQADPAEQLTARRWRAGDDVRHTEYGHGWVQGSGHGRVTIRFETRRTGPGQARTMADDDPGLTPADPLASLD